MQTLVASQYGREQGDEKGLPSMSVVVIAALQLLENRLYVTYHQSSMLGKDQHCGIRYQAVLYPSKHFWLHEAAVQEYIFSCHFLALGF